MFGVLICAAVSLQAPNTLQVNEQTTPGGALKADFRATNRLPGLAATRFAINVSTNPAVIVGGEFSSSTHWRGVPTTPIVNPASLDPDITSFFDLFLTPLSYVFEPASVAFDATSPEIPYGWGGGSVLNPLRWNTTYNWQIQLYKPNGPGFTASGWSVPAAFTMGMPSATASANGNGGPEGESWRFVALPIMPGTTVPASELLDDVALLHRLDEPTRSWILITNPAEPLEGGRGYLAYCGHAAVIDLTQGSVAHGDPTLAFSYTSSALPLGQETTSNEFRGNHLFGNPFNTSIRWRWIADPAWYGFPPPSGFQPRQGDVHSWGSGIPLDFTVSPTYYRWDGTQFLIYNGFNDTGSAGPTIAPFQAVGIVALDPAAQIQLRQPPPKAGVGVPKLGNRAVGPPDPNRWGLTLEVSSAGAIDTENMVGLDFEADDAWDPRDSEEPGTLNTTWVLLSMDHRAWSLNPRLYTHDFRKTPADAGDEVLWSLTLDGNTGQPATLTWPGFSTSGWTVTLEDPAAPAIVDLSAATSYDTAPVTGKSTLLLRARRLASFQGALELVAAGGPAAAAVEAGSSGVAMLELELRAVDEPVTLRSFSVAHAGTGDPAHASVSLRRGGVRIAGPTPFTAGVASWTALAERVDPGAPQAWTVDYDFDAQARGSYQAVVSASQAEGLGGYSAKSLVPAPASLQGAAMNLTAPEGSGAGDGSCGLLGWEALLLVLASRRVGRRSLKA